MRPNSIFVTDTDLGHCYECSVFSVHSSFFSFRPSMPQDQDTFGVILRYSPGPKIPLCCTISAVPKTLIPLTFHGSTETRSSTTKATLFFPAFTFLYFFVLGRIS